MKSITHLIDSIESFSKQNFKFSQYLQPLNILNRITDSISNRLNEIDFIHHLDDASKHVDWLNKFFEDSINPVTKKEISHLKSSKKKDIQISYADFKVDEPPLFKNEIVDQFSFEDIINEKNIGPVRRRNPESFTFDSVCPYCGAPKEYIYDNNKGMGLVSTVLIANEKLLYTMIAMAVLFTSACIKTIPITNIIKKF